MAGHDGQEAESVWIFQSFEFDGSGTRAEQRYLFTQSSEMYLIFNTQLTCRLYRGETQHKYQTQSQKQQHAKQLNETEQLVNGYLKPSQSRRLYRGEAQSRPKRINVHLANCIPAKKNHTP